MSYTPSHDCYREPLLPGNIRLLRILPEKDQKAPIHCELFHYSLQESEKRTHLYEAISYVWGDPNETRSIHIKTICSTSNDETINAHILPVTMNLYAALSSLRYPFVERTIWVDAVCVDQDNEQEKGHQIQFMTEIYGRASRVVVWLGETADDSDEALREIAAYADDGIDRTPPPNSTRQATEALLQRPWFERIWVLQEVAAARQIVVICGNTEVDGYAFAKGVDGMRALLHSLNACKVHSVVDLIKRRIPSPGPSSDTSERPSLNLRPLGQLLDMYHAHKATKHHDKIYALLGMSSDDPRKVGIRPNYQLQWDELFQQLTKYLLHKDIIVETWGNDAEFIGIKSKGSLLGIVAKVLISGGFEIYFVDGYRAWFNWTFLSSTKHIRKGDALCLLHGASQPIIIRKVQDYFDIVVIAPRLEEQTTYSSFGGQRASWSECLPASTSYTRDFLLLWDWDDSLKTVPYLQGYQAMSQMNRQVDEPCQDRAIGI